MGSLLEKILASLFNAVAQGLQVIGGWLNFKPLKDLFYQATFSLTYPSPFTKAEWSKMDSIFAGVLGLAFFMMVISVLSTSFKFMSASMDVRKRQEANESMWRWVGAVVMMAAIPVIARVLCNLNNILVIGIKSLLPAGVIALGAQDFNIQTNSPLVDSICTLFYVWQYFSINVMYLVRDWVIFIMYAFGPIAVFLWSINKEVTAYAVFMGELMSNIFLQSAYALVGLVILSFIAVKNGDANQAAIMKLIGITMMTPLAKVIRNGLQGLWVRWAGVDEEHISGNFMRGAVSTALLGADSLGRLAGTFKKRSPDSPDAPKDTTELNAPSSNYEFKTAENQAAYQTRTEPPEIKGDPREDIKYDYTPENTAVFGAYAEDPPEIRMPNDHPPVTAPRITSNPLVTAANVGRSAYSVASTVTRGALSIGAGMIPGGETIAKIAGYGAGKVAQIGASTVALAGAVALQAKQTGLSPLEVLKQATGTEHNNWKGPVFTGLKTAGVMTSEWINPNWTPALMNFACETNLDNYHKRLPLKF